MGQAGELILGTGHNGQVYRLDASGKSESIFKAEQLDIYALALGANGDVLVGTSPNGRVYRIGKDKKPIQVFDPEERFIWDLKEDRQGNVICAVGNNGAVYSINKSGQVETLLGGEDSHIVSLWLSRDDSILAGSGNRGMLYQIKNRKVRVLCTALLEEIRSIGEDGEGNIYFAAVRNAAPAKPLTLKEFDIESVFKKSSADEKPTPKEKSILYCLKSDGTLERLWSSEEETIYSVYYDPQSAAVIVGTGNAGRIYRVKRDGSWAQIYESDSAQIYRIVGNGRGFLALANNTASLTQFENGMTSSGTYFSDVFDARTTCRFGRINWQADLPGSTGISLAVRYGNSENPDKTWSAWSAPFTSPENSIIAVEGYRFLQIKALLNSNNPLATPVLNSYKIYYLESNLKPEIKEITVRRGGEEERRGTEDEGRLSRAASPSGLKTLQVSWTAETPNQDRLSFNVYIKRSDSLEWLPLKKNIQEKSLKLKSDLFADGKYQIKVDADDSPDNPASLVKTATLISAPFVIDSTAPLIKDLTVSGGTLSFTAVDETSAISQVLVSSDGNLWQPLFPDSGIADSRSEHYSLNLAGFKANKFLFIKVVDEYQNYKVFQKEI